MDDGEHESDEFCESQGDVRRFSIGVGEEDGSTDVSCGEEEGDGEVCSSGPRHDIERSEVHSRDFREEVFRVCVSASSQ